MNKFLTGTLLLLLVLQFAAAYPWGDENQAEGNAGFEENQLDTYKDAAKRASYNFKCATATCQYRSREPTLRCCPGMRCRCGILWNAGHCKCTSFGYGYGR